MEGLVEVFSKGAERRVRDHEGEVPPARSPRDFLSRGPGRWPAGAPRDDCARRARRAPSMPPAVARALLALRPETLALMLIVPGRMARASMRLMQAIYRAAHQRIPTTEHRVWPYLLIWRPRGRTMSGAPTSPTSRSQHARFLLVAHGLGEPVRPARLRTHYERRRSRPRRIIPALPSPGASAPGISRWMARSNIFIAHGRSEIPTAALIRPLPQCGTGRP